MFRSRRAGGGLPLLLLAFQLMNALSGGNGALPTTFGIIIGNLLAYLQPNIAGRSFRWHWPVVDQVCISAGRVWYYKEWSRLFLSPFFHLDDWHIYYNMASFLWKGISLERHYGSAYFLYMVAVFSVLSSAVYCGLQFALTEFFDQASYMWQCAAGFSAVIFALKVVTTYGMPHRTVYIMGMIPVPSRHAVWAELVLISVLVPRASFVGHLAGILVGMAYVMGPLKVIMDFPIGGIQLTGHRRRPRLQGSGVSGYRSQYAGARRPVNRAGVHRNRNGATDEQDEDLQAAIQRSLTDTGPVPESEERHERPPPYNPHYDPSAHDAARDQDQHPGLDLVHEQVASAPQASSNQGNQGPTAFEAVQVGGDPTSSEASLGCESVQSEQRDEMGRSSLRQRHPRGGGERSLDNLRAARLARLNNVRRH